MQKLMIAFTVTICMVAMAANCWKVATRPDLSFELVVDFSQPYSPPALNSNDVARIMYQMIPSPSDNEIAMINETVANVNLRVLPYWENTVQIVATSKSWQMQPGRTELLARAAAKSIALHAIESHIDASITSEVSSRGRVLVPKTILADFDRTKR